MMQYSLGLAKRVLPLTLTLLAACAAPGATATTPPSEPTPLPPVANTPTSAPVLIEPPPTVADTPTPALDLTGPTPPSIIKSIGFEMGEVDLAAGRAGDVLLAGVQTPFGKIIYDYGEEITNSSGGPKINLQPTFYLPIGTKVRSLIDGVVVDVPTLWSGDYSIMVAPQTNSKYIWETEHVLNPVVKVGDHVVAGQVVAEVSNFQSQYTPDVGAVEIGLLEGGNPPRHLCPFLYLDPSVADQIERWLVGLRAAWETLQGDPGIYDEGAYATPGCKITDPLEG